MRIRYRKHSGGAHWVSGPGPIYLGEDGWGRWFGWPDSTEFTRPGARFISSGVQVGCYPRDRWHCVAFHVPHPGAAYRLYVDVATAGEWERGADGLPEITCVDLDLDVLQFFDGTVLLDDEDEFAEHRVALQYPPDLVNRAEQEAIRLLTEIRAEDPRFAESLAERWREEFARLSPG